MSTFPQFSLLKHLEKNAPVICDGAKLPLLQELGFPETSACFMANLTHPQLVPQVYQNYLRAGASILRTNTESAHRFVLDELQLLDRLENINNNGMALLREGVGMLGIPAGSVTSVKKDVIGEIPLHLLERAYGEQFIYLADTGAKFIMLSEFTDLEDLKTALRVAKHSVQRQLVAHLRLCQQEDVSVVLEKMQELWERGTDFIGIQASSQYHHLSLLMETLVDHFGIVSVLLDEPAPLPFGQVSPEFRKVAQTLLEQEVAILGGGHHTTPAHIQSITEIVTTLPASC
ncbi:MAG: homocysteine S-methyltransferase family protein [SAR324 cluster bacterium]|nr:homocysteine S-methyltransferase family protein [SAR324 cluster bacterium]